MGMRIGLPSLNSTRNTRAIIVTSSNSSNNNNNNSNSSIHTNSLLLINIMEAMDISKNRLMTMIYCLDEKINFYVP